MILSFTRIGACVSVVVLFTVTAVLPVHAQFPGGPNFAAGRNITVQGVYLDTKRMLRNRAVGNSANRFRQTAKRNRSFVTISLPKLFAEVQRLKTANKPIPDRIRYLEGMVKLQFVIVDAGKKGLRIAGPAEPIDLSNPLRPRGKRTGRPVLQLDDLVVALRTVGPGQRGDAFGCTLLQDPKAAGRVAEFQRKFARIRPGQQREMQAAMKTAVGPLKAKFFGVPADTRFAFVCVEADYVMKRISLGLDRPPIRGLRSYVSLSSGKSLLNWFWFIADYPPLTVSEDGRVFEIPPHGLKLLADSVKGKTGEKNPAARKFATLFTKRLPELERVVPCFADLQNLADLGVLAALIDADGLHKKSSWDLAWLLKPSGGYPVTTVPTPREAETLVTFLTRGRRTVTAAGGVQLSARKFTRHRKTVEKLTIHDQLKRGDRKHDTLWSFRADWSGKTK